MRFSIGTKLLLGFGATIVATVLVMCVVVGVQLRASSVEGFHAATAKELAQLDRAMSIFVDKALGMTVALASLPVVQQADSSIHKLCCGNQENFSQGFRAEPLGAAVAGDFCGRGQGPSGIRGSVFGHSMGRVCDLGGVTHAPGL